MQKKISSLSNPLVKEYKLLQEKSRIRKINNRFVIEGLRELSLAVKNDFFIKTILYCKTIIDNHEFFSLPQVDVIQITPEIYHKLAYRNSTEGILAIVESKTFSIENIQLPSQNSLILVAEAPEKPGNIGALLRTADAANLDAVIIANPKTDMYNPNIIRSSVGCLFSNQIAAGTSQEIIAFLNENQINIYSAILQQSVPYHTCDFTKNTAIVVGTEATGLSEIWRTKSLQNIHIPMQGNIDSLNVSVAAGIIIFEAKRQRNFTV